MQCNETMARKFFLRKIVGRECSGPDWTSLHPFISRKLDLFFCLSFIFFFFFGYLAWDPITHNNHVTIFIRLKWIKPSDNLLISRMWNSKTSYAS